MGDNSSVKFINIQFWLNCKSVTESICSNTISQFPATKKYMPKERERDVLKSYFSDFKSIFRFGSILICFFSILLKKSKSKILFGSFSSLHIFTLNLSDKNGWLSVRGFCGEGPKKRKWGENCTLCGFLIIPSCWLISL